MLDTSKVSLRIVTPLFLVAMMLVGCAFTMKNFIGNKKFSNNWVNNTWV